MWVKGLFSLSSVTHFQGRFHFYPLTLKKPTYSHILSHAVTYPACFRFGVIPCLQLQMHGCWLNESGPVVDWPLQTGKDENVFWSIHRHYVLVSKLSWGSFQTWILHTLTLTCLFTKVKKSGMVTPFSVITILQRQLQKNKLHFNTP